jgi:hypothetical protein
MKQNQRRFFKRFLLTVHGIIPVSKSYGSQSDGSLIGRHFHDEIVAGPKIISRRISAA